MVKTWRKRLFGAFMVKMCECAKLRCVNMEWISVCNHHFCGVANIENTLTAGYHWMRNARILISAGKLMRRQQFTLFLRRHNVISHFYNHTWIRAERFEKVEIAHHSFIRLTEWDFLSKWQIEHKHTKHKNISGKHFRKNKFDFCRTEFYDRSSAKGEKTENSAKNRTLSEITVKCVIFWWFKPVFFAHNFWVVEERREKLMKNTGKSVELNISKRNSTKILNCEHVEGVFTSDWCIFCVWNDIPLYESGRSFTRSFI